MEAPLGIAALPIEWIAQWTDEGTQRLLPCVCRTWRAALLKKEAPPRRRACCNPSMLGLDHIGGSSKCLDSHACLVRYMRCLVRQRRWALFDWLRDLMEPSKDTDGIWMSACIAAATDGNLERLQAFVAFNRNLSARYFIQEAVLYGHQHVIDWICAMEIDAKRDHGTSAAIVGDPAAPKAQTYTFLANKHLCDKAAEGGHLSILMWLREMGCPWSKSTCAMAAAGGHLVTLQWLRTNGCPWDRLVCTNAASGGHLAVLQWARANGCSWNAEGCLSSAAKHGHLHIIRWMHTTGHSWTQRKEETSLPSEVSGDGESKPTWPSVIPDRWGMEAMEQAARGGHLHVMQWMRANGCPWDARVCQMAALGGHLNVLEWACENGCQWGSWACVNAIQGGHLHVIEWAHTNGYPLDRDGFNCAWAAGPGHLGVLQWLRAHGCAWDAETCSLAAAAGHLHVIQWARAHGCPWNEWAYEQARYGKNKHIVAWLEANGCPRP